MLSKNVLNAIALIVTGVWSLSFLAQFIPTLQYDPDPQIHLIFGSLVGAAFALPSIPRLLGRKPEGEEETSGRHRKSDANKGGD